MKVVFLDFDGVLVNRASWLSTKEADPQCVAALNRIIEQTGAHIVVSSSWRCGSPVAELRKILHRWGVMGKVLGCTPQLHDSKRGLLYIAKPRGAEIQAWINKYKSRQGIDSFVILDDDSDMEHLTHRLVKTDFDIGLTTQHAEQAVAMLLAS